jgi:hypothetical protein
VIYFRDIIFQNERQPTMLARLKRRKYTQREIPVKYRHVFKLDVENVGVHGCLKGLDVSIACAI